jgi:hypothetical protein
MGHIVHTQIWRRGGKVLVLEAGPFLLPEHGQNLARGLGFDAPDPVLPESSDGKQPRKEVWGIPWRGNQIFPAGSDNSHVFPEYSQLFADPTLAERLSTSTLEPVA